MANGTGIATPISLLIGSNTITVTRDGTFIVTLPAGIDGTAISGTCAVTGSPQALSAGANTVIITGTGVFTITLTCLAQQTVVMIPAAKQVIDLEFDLSNLTQVTTIREYSWIDGINPCQLTAKVYPTVFDPGTKAGKI